MNHKPLEIIVYLLGTVLTLFIFAFGSFSKDLGADIFENPFTVSLKTAFGGVVASEELEPFLYELKDNYDVSGNFYLLNDGDTSNTEALNEIEEILPNVNLKEVYIKGNPYGLARDFFNGGERVFLLGIIDVPHSEDVNMNELQNMTLKKIINNFEIDRIDQTAINNVDAAKAVMYYCYFMNARKTDIKDSGFYFRQGESDKVSEVTMLGFGDVMLGRFVRTLMDKNGMNYPFEKIGKLDGVDFVHANFEGPVKEVYVPTSKSIEFRFKPDVVWVLKQAGINIVTLANNHALDQGWGGREDTKKYLNEAGIRYFGHPKNEEADNVYITEVSGKKLAFIGYDDTIFKLDFKDSFDMIAKYDKQVDYVIVSVHWGVEYKHTPTQRKKDLAHTFVDAGADLIIGHHPHVVQTMEVYNGVPIFYSLGNFVFDQYWSADTQEGMGFGAVMGEKGITLYLFPYYLPASQPQFMNAEQRAAFFDKFVSWGQYSDELAEQIRQGRIEINL